MIQIYDVKNHSQLFVYIHTDIKALMPRIHRELFMTDNLLVIITNKLDQFAYINIIVLN